MYCFILPLLLIPLWCLVPSMVILNAICLWSRATCECLKKSVMFCILWSVLHMYKSSLSKQLVSVKWFQLHSLCKAQISVFEVVICPNSWMISNVCAMSSNKRVKWIALSCLLCFLCVFFCLALEGMQNTRIHVSHSSTLIHLHDSGECLPYIHIISGLPLHFYCLFVCVLCQNG